MTQETLNAVRIFKALIDRGIKTGLFQNAEDAVAAINAYNQIDAAVKETVMLEKKIEDQQAQIKVLQSNGKENVVTS